MRRESCPFWLRNNAIALPREERIARYVVDLSQRLKNRENSAPCALRSISFVSAQTPAGGVIKQTDGSYLVTSQSTAEGPMN
jgi:hypothetical protein